MSQYNENVICFVGDEGHMRNVILALAANYERSEPRLAEKGLTYESPGLAGLSDRVVGQASVPDMVGELNQVCWDPLYALDPASEVSVGGDDLPEEAVACEKVKGADGEALGFVEGTDSQREDGPRAKRVGPRQSSCQARGPERNQALA